MHWDHSRSIQSKMPLNDILSTTGAQRSTDLLFRYDMLVTVEVQFKCATDTVLSVGLCYRITSFLTFPFIESFACLAT